MKENSASMRKKIGKKLHDVLLATWTNACNNDSAHICCKGTK